MRKTQNCHFLSLKNLSPSQFLGELQLTQISLNFKTFCNLKIRGLGANLCVFYFNFERKYDVLKSKSPCILLNKNINFNWNVTESKIENPRETNLVFQSPCKNRKLKVRLWWAGARKRKKRAVFVPFILSEGKHLCFISNA